jgi:lipoprotein NlpD
VFKCCSCLKVLLILAIVFVSSCSKHHPAPVKDASRKAVVNSAQPISKQKKYKPKYMTVKKGDTLYSIGFNHSIDYKYLAQINGIKPPYSIFPGQKLRLQANKSLVNNTKSSTTVVSTHPVKSQQPQFKSITEKKKAPIKAQLGKKTTPVKPLIKASAKPQLVVKKTNRTQVNQVVAQANTQWKWPLKGRILSTFLASDVSRKGIDISAKLNTPVFASQNGIVVYSGDGLRGYGELIIIKHSNNLLSAYAHNSSRLVKEGVAVKQGQIIAKSGKGTDGQGLLHFEIRKNGQPVNPLKYLPK